MAPTARSRYKNSPRSWNCARGAKFYSLQFRAAEEVAKHWEITDLGSIEDPSTRFVPSAAVIRCLDFCICVTRRSPTWPERWASRSF
jgi:hypothetical protein